MFVDLASIKAYLDVDNVFFLSSEKLALSLAVRAGVCACVRAAVVVAASEGTKKETPSPRPARALSVAAWRPTTTTSGGYGGLPCPTSVGRTSQRSTFKASDYMGKFLFSFTFFFFFFVCICCGSGAGVVGLWSSCCHPRACV